MNKLKLLLCAGGAMMGLAYASLAFADDQATPASPPAAGAAPAATPASPPPPPTPPPYPSMGPTLSNNATSASFDAGPLGKLYVNGDFSGLFYVQDNPGFDPLAGKLNKDDGVDFSNAMVTIQKDDGPVQFVIEAGGYSFPALGATYLKATEQTSNTFGVVPVGYVKIVPNSTVSIEVGQLPTLIGAELPFTFENANIERGLLWNQEPLISRGVQVNWSSGSWAASLAWTDGYYSNEYTSISGEVTYTFKNSDTLEVAGAGNTSTNLPCTATFSCFAPFATPLGQQEGQIYNVIYTHTQGPWTITPYFQYNTVPHDFVTGASASMWGLAVIGKYSFTPEVSLAGRFEYESSSGAYNMLYGAGSNAWSFTLTPTYQKGIFYARIEGSYTGIGSGTPGFEFGPAGVNSSQVRGMLEAGVIF
jgi:hypothetical protein